MAVQIRSKIGAQRRAFELNRPDDPARKVTCLGCPKRIPFDKNRRLCEICRSFCKQFRGSLGG